MEFLNCLWDKIAPIYQQILSHPFNLELASGTLSREQFTFYMQQDAYYLIEFSKTLALIAGRSRSAQMVNDFLDFSLQALVAERSLHSHFLEQSDGVPIELAVSPACMAYTRYLIATASNASLEEAIAAVLPCFWVYREVGQSIKKISQKSNPYVLWIDTYSNEEFSHGVDQAQLILDGIASQSSPHILNLMTEAFEYSTLLEWHFWNDAYHMSTFRKSYMLNT